MKTVAKLFLVGISACLVIIYVVTMPATDSILITLRPTPEPKTDFIFPNSADDGNIGHLDDNHIAVETKLQTEEDIYHDPYLNVKYRVDTSVVDSFNVKEYIANAAHDADPMKLNSFDQNRSDYIGAYRQVTDSRHWTCLNHKEDWSNLPASSVIMTFYNEARSALLRSVTSVLKRTPPHLLKDIILVDDCSDDLDLGRLLKGLDPKIKVLRNIERQGLVRSRIYGALNAAGPILTFLDSHIECNVDWIEPLLYQLTQKPRGIVSPIIDPIKAEDLMYKVASSNIKGECSLNHFELASSVIFFQDILQDIFSYIPIDNNIDIQFLVVVCSGHMCCSYSIAGRNSKFSQKF